MPSRASRSLPLVLALAALPALGACGGGSGGGTSDDTLGPTETLVVLADDDRTGALTEAPNGARFGPSDFAIVGQTALISGTGAASDREFRAVVTFARPDIDASATVVRAVLTCQNILAGGGFIGANQAVVGDALIDHVDVGAVLDTADFDSASLDAAFAVFVQVGQITASTGDIITVDVTEQVQADISSGRDQTGFRMYCPAAIVGGGGPAQLFIDGSDPFQFPTLTIEFRR